MNNGTKTAMAMSMAMGTAALGVPIFGGTGIVAHSEVAASARHDEYAKKELSRTIPKDAETVQYVRSGAGQIIYVKFKYDGECFMATSGMKQRSITKVECK